MAKFLDTTGISHYLQQLINNTQDKLILISPYLKVNDRIKQSLEERDRMKIEIRIIYGKSELMPSEENWFKSLRYVRMCFCQNLHAKCYLNEKEAIITSMNLYDFSQINNEEMGIYITKNEDPQVYEDIYRDANRLFRIGDDAKNAPSQMPKISEKVISFSQTAPATLQKLPGKVSTSPQTSSGFCIRWFLIAANAMLFGRKLEMICMRKNTAIFVVNPITLRKLNQAVMTVIKSIKIFSNFLCNSLIGG